VALVRSAHQLPACTHSFSQPRLDNCEHLKRRHPLLIVDYADAPCSGGTSVPACGPSGLNPDSLSITLDSVSAADPSSNSRQGLFYRYANRAVENRVQIWPQ